MYEYNDLSQLSIRKYAKQKTTCYVRGAERCYTKIPPFRYNEVVQAIIIKREGKVIKNGTESKLSGTYEVDVQISHRLHTKV